MSELWASIPNFPLYDASNLGRIRHIKRRHKILSPQLVNKHYSVSLYRNGEQFGVRVHKAVMEAFVGPMPEGKQTAHLDGDPSNNALSNLIYATPKENNDHKYIHGTILFGDRHPMAVLTEAQVKEIRASYKKYSKDANAVILARKYGVATSTVNMLISRRNWGWL